MLMPSLRSDWSDSDAVDLFFSSEGNARPTVGPWSLMLDSFQPSFDAKNKRIVEEDPEPFIVDVPRVPKDKGTDVSGSGTPAIPAPGRPEVEDDDLPFQTPLTAICWETKPKEVSLKTKGAKEVLIHEPRKDRGSPSKGAEVTKTTSTTADPGTTPGPN